MLDFFRILLGVLSFIALKLPTDLSVIIPWAYKGSIIAIIAAVAYKLLRIKEPFVHKNLLFFEISYTLVLMKDFCKIWMASSKIAIIAGKLHLTLDMFLLLSSMILGFFAIGIIDLLLSSVIRLWKYVCKNIDEKLVHKIENAFLIVLVVSMEAFQMNYSSLYSFELIKKHHVNYIFISVLMVLIVNLLIYAIVQKWNIVLTISAVFFSIWAVLNYYVIQFHGSPYYFSEFKNTFTAMAVMGEYKYAIDLVTVTLIAFLICEVWFSVHRFGNAEKKNYIVTSVIYFVLSFALFGVLATFKDVFIPEKTSSRTWIRNERTYGFLISNFRDMAVSSQQFIKPEGYDKNNLLFDRVESGDITEVYPDIILILNETFCDLDIYSDLQTDIDYLESFYNIENAHYGYAIIPGIGGGTNNAEFELLTSKSMFLVTNTAPYTWMTSTLENRSIVQYLKNLGYYTTGMHCATAANYNRDRAYPAVGFDNILLGHDAFSYLSYNGERSWLDSDNYKDLIDQYNLHTDKGPQLLYLLTLQNHGGFEKNDASLDTVHTTLDFGNLTDDINEYLSSVQLSAEAFHELTDYYKSVSKPVIICMVGDHAPSFITSMPQNERNSGMDTEISMRTVPYAIWSNYGVDFEINSEYVSLVDIVPLILKSASMPLSPFYQTVITLNNEIPVRTSNGLYIDKNGVTGTYSINDDKFDELNKYYCLEYNSLMGSDEYRKELFFPQ